MNVLVAASALASQEADEKISSSLFSPRYKDAYLLNFKQISDQEQVKSIEIAYSQLKLSGKIITILQPTQSAELNSENYTLILESGEKLHLRRCKKYIGKNRYLQLAKLLSTLKGAGVSVPEFYSQDREFLPYFELDQNTAKTIWIFFKHISAKSFFSGNIDDFTAIAEQIGKMHAALKKHYGKAPAIIENTHSSDSNKTAFLTSTMWKEYLSSIQKREKKDEYDQSFLDNQALIELMIQFVEDNTACLEDNSDEQNIHFDLNNSNFLTHDGVITIMDFDDVRLGNIYTDIGFALHRLIVTCLETGEKDLSSLVQKFIDAYQKGNPKIKLNFQKLKVAMYNRALRNIAANLDLKYKKNSSDWLSSIPINILRLKQVQFLALNFPN